MYSSVAAAQTIVVQVVNGHSDRPIGAHKVIHVTFNTGQIRHLLTLHTNAQGEVEFDAQGATEFKVAADGYGPCDQPEALNKSYSVDEVSTDGVVTFNDCSQWKRPPVPGRLIYLVKPEKGWGQLNP